MNPLHPSFMLLAFSIILLGGWAIGNGHWIGFVAVVVGVVWWLVLLIGALLSVLDDDHS